MHETPSYTESATDKATYVHTEINDESAMAHDSTGSDVTSSDNYHGLHAETVMVYFSLLLIAIAQLLNVVGSGAVSVAGMWPLLDPLTYNIGFYLVCLGYLCSRWRLVKIGLDSTSNCDRHCVTWPYGSSSCRLLGQEVVPSLIDFLRCYWKYHRVSSYYYWYGYCWRGRLRLILRCSISFVCRCL